MHQADSYSLEHPALQQTEQPSRALDVDLTSPANQQLLSEMTSSSKDLPPDFGNFEIAGGDGGPHADQNRAATDAETDGRSPREADGRPPREADGRPPREADGRPPREADGRPPREQQSFEDRMENFNNRIYKGIAEGSIKQHEYGRLSNHLDDLTKTYDQMKNGGLTDAEKAQLARKMEMQSLRIFRDRHDSDAPLPPDHKPIDRTDIEERLNRQQARLTRGAEDGSLTEGESKRLARQVERISDAYDRAMCGGLSDKEQARLVERLDLQSLRIFHDRHDSAVKSCDDTRATA